MSKLKETQKQGYKTLVAIAVIGIAVYLGFEPLIKFVPDGVAKSVISSSFGAIFVIILTMYLLNKQTEIEQESKKGERVFDEKVKLYQNILDITRDMMMDGKITKEEINRLPFPLIRLGMLGRNETVEAFKAVNNELNKIYSNSDGDIVELGDEDKNTVYKLLAMFAAKCREDLEIGEEVIDEEMIASTVATIASTGKKKRDMTKFSFDGKEYPKNRYIHKVVKNFSDENPGMSLDEFSAKVPRSTDFRKDLWKTLAEAKEVEERDRKRHYSNPDEVIKLEDETICITSGQSQEGTLLWIELFKNNGIRTE